MNKAMSNSENIVYQDAQITRIIEQHKGGAAPVLFERYRISGENRDAFVAALIGRLCLLDAVHRQKRNPHVSLDRDSREGA